MGDKGVDGGDPSIRNRAHRSPRIWFVIIAGLAVVTAGVLWATESRRDSLVGQWTIGGRLLPDGSDPAAGLSIGVRESTCPDGALILAAAWPLGQTVPSALNGPNVRSYAQDPEGVLSAVESVPFMTADSLPSLAQDTGIHRGAWSIWSIPGSEEQFLWLWNGSRAERWPRLEDLSACQ